MHKLVLIWQLKNIHYQKKDEGGEEEEIIEIPRKGSDSDNDEQDINPMLSHIISSLLNQRSDDSLFVVL